jgi:hypothetical protein
MPTNPCDERPRVTVSELAEAESCAAAYATEWAADEEALAGSWPES